MSVEISVIITAYKERPFLMEAIESTLNQTLSREHYEIILVSNYMNANLEEYLNANMVKWLKSAEESQGKKIMEGLSIASGNVIAFLEDDDIFRSDKLQRVQEAFMSDGDLIYYHNLTNFIDGDGNEIAGRPVIEQFIRSVERIGTIRYSYSGGERHNPYREFDTATYNLSAIAVRRRLVSENSEIISSLKLGMDTIMYILAVRMKGVIMVDAVKSSSFRFHQQNTSLDSAVNSEGWVERIGNTMEMMYENRKAFYDLAKDTDAKDLIRSTAHYYFISLIFHNIINRRSGRLSNLINVFSYLAHSRISEIIHRKDVVYYSFLAAINPEKARKSYMDRRAQIALSVGAGNDEGMPTSH